MGEEKMSEKKMGEKKMGEEEESEGCSAQCRKLRWAITHYGASFLAVCFSYVAFNVAFLSPLMDPFPWVSDFKTDIWYGSKPVSETFCFGFLKIHV